MTWHINNNNGGEQKKNTIKKEICKTKWIFFHSRSRTPPSSIFIFGAVYPP